MVSDYDGVPDFLQFDLPSDQPELPRPSPLAPPPHDPDYDDGLPEEEPYEEEDEPNPYAGWPRPTPLIRYADDLPVDAMGPVLGPLVVAMAHTYQVPTDLIINMMWAVISTAMQGRWWVRVHRSWREIGVLDTLSIVDSSGGKSTVLKVLMEPLREFEQRKRADMKAIIANEEAQAQLLADDVDAARRKVRGAKNEAAKQTAQLEYRHAVAKQAEHEVPQLPLLTCTDVTAEGLVFFCEKQGKAASIISAESGALDTLAGRYSAGNPSLDVVNNGWSADPIGSFRKTSEPNIVDEPAITVGVATQPGTAKALGEKRAFGDSGFLGRCLMIVRRGLMGWRNLDPDDVPQELSEAWALALTRVAEVAWEGRMNDRRRTVHLDADARALINAFRHKIEPWFRDGGVLEHMDSFGGKLHAHAVRMALARTIMERADAETIDAVAMQDAAVVAEAYIAHHYTALALMGGDTPVQKLVVVMDYLTERGERVVKHTDVRDRLRERTATKGITSAELEERLDMLERYGHVRKDGGETGPRGGRKVLRWEVNPWTWHTQQP